MPFTTSYHTQLPEYAGLRVPIPASSTFAYLRRFHGAARSTLVPTWSMQKMLEGKGFSNVAIWSRGVDTAVFQPEPRADLALPRPIWINAGRISVEKNRRSLLKARTSDLTNLS